MAVQLEIKRFDGVPHYPRTRWNRQEWVALKSTVSTVSLGSRHYVDARTGLALPSVTSVLGMEPAPGLEYWKRKNVATLAVESAEFISRLDPEGAVNYLLKTADNNNEAADKGSEVHDFAERLVLGEDVRESDVPERVRPHFRHFNDYLDTVQPATHSAELIAWNETDGVAGSYDWMGTIKVNPETRKFDPQGEPQMVVGDYKTGKLHPKVAKQLVAYATADKVVDFDGNELPMPEINGGVVLHITEEGWDLRPVNIGERVREAFLADLTYFNAFREWDSSHAGIILPSLAKSASGRQTGTERRK